MSSPTFGSKGSFSQVWIRGDLAWKSFALDNNNSQPWDLYGPQSLMSQLLNKQVLIGLPLLKERLANMDQRDSDDLFKVSMLHSYLSLPFSLCLSTSRGWHGNSQHKVKCSSRISVGWLNSTRSFREPPSVSFSSASKGSCSGLWLPCLVYKVT